MLDEQKDLRDDLSKINEKFYKNRSTLNYRYLEWYEIIAERNSESDPFEYDNFDISDENCVTISMGGGYIELDQEESKNVVEIFKEHEARAEEYRKERLAEGEILDEDEVYDFFIDEISYSLKELDYGAGSTWYVKKSIDINNLIEDARIINTDLEQLGKNDLRIVDDLV